MNAEHSVGKEHIRILEHELYVQKDELDCDCNEMDKNVNR